MRTTTRRCLAVGAAAAMAASTMMAATAEAGPSTTAQAEEEPTVRLHTTKLWTKAFKYDDRVRVDLPVYLVAGDTGFEIQAKRPAYTKPITTSVVTPGGAVEMPQGTQASLRRLSEFMHVKITNRDGDVVLRRASGLCAGESYRFAPDSPMVSTYPEWCPYGDLSLGAVYGIDPGHAMSAFGYGFTANLPRGLFSVKAWIDKDYREAIGLKAGDATVNLKMRVVKGEDECEFGCKTEQRSATEPPSFALSEGTGPDSPVPTQPAEREPTDAGAAADVEYRPDLRSIPAFAIGLTKRGYLSFAANVWNAGPSPLVIDGFRRDGEDVMDAYQYFYDADGNPYGYQLAGTMEWDPKRGHHHWHFTDFARYRLLDADKDHVLRSRKEAFCLANTDAIDYTRPGANMRPEGTDLHTSCGNSGSLSLREVLDVGSGDTYYQFVAGQSFNVQNLPNGKYFIAVEANPEGNLHETNTSNNVRYRKIYLRGSGENRRVVVPPLGTLN